MATPTGFVNLGASCFVNATLQAVLRVPGFQEAIRSGSSATERALRSTFALMTSSTAVVPTPITDLFYRGRQEDAHEFLVNLFAECPSVHNIFAGQEMPSLRCKHCRAGRDCVMETFLMLQLSLMGASPARSIQEALHNYLRAEVEQTDYQDWCCYNAECFEHGRALDKPLHGTNIISWPSCLVLALKRWDPTHGLLSHQVYCNDVLAAGSTNYKLHAVVTHVGVAATSGHYLAHRREACGFVTLNDASIGITNPANITSFDTVANEKVYMAVYTKLEPSLPATIAVDAIHTDDNDSDVIPDIAPPESSLPPLAACKRKTIDLDSESSETILSRSITAGTRREPAESPCRKRKVIELDTEDSASPDDAAAQHVPGDKNASKRGQSQSSAARLKAFTHEEQKAIRSSLEKSADLASALAEIRESVPHFTCKDNNRPGYIPRSTLRRWHKSSAQRERAFGADAAPSTPRAKSQPTKPRNCANADNKSSPALRSSCAKGRPSKPRNFSNAEKSAMQKAVSSTPNWQDAWAAIQKAVPGISYENPQAEKYVPKSTLEEWRRHPTRLAPKPAANTWTEESARFFSVSVPRPNLRQARQASHPSDTWFSSSSWTFCPKCGRHRPRGHASKDTVSGADECRPCCDTSAEDLLEPFEGHPPSKLMAYVTPQMCNWLPIMESATVTDTVLQHVEVAALQVLDIYVDYRTRRGGKAEVVSKQKTSVVRAEWRAESLLTLRKDESQKAIFDWLMHNNTTYRQFVEMHDELCKTQLASDKDWRRIPTATLLLQLSGIEVAFRPWLHPLASFGDSDISNRLVSLGRISVKSKPSLRASFMRKVLSRCTSYARDFQLQALIYDIGMARTISSVVAKSNSLKIAAEHLSSDMDHFDEYWHQQLNKMEDICRLEYEKYQDMTKALPSVFFTVAPAEWTFPLHDGMFFEDSLSNQQSIMTLHMYHALQSMLEKHFLAEGTHLARVGLAKIRQWSLRFEFQSRGTVHVHCVLWADFCPGTDIEKLCGRTDTKHDSEFVRVLENLFKCRVDVQCGDGNYVLMRYVAGYLSKASDALKFRATEATSNLSTWRQVYRLLCKKSPLEQELIMEFAGLPMVMHSFTGCHLFAPVPGSSAQNTSRDFYAAYQQLLQAGEDSSQSREARSLSFMQWLRRYNVQLVGQRGPDATYKITERAQRGRHSGKDCGIAMKFAFELLDIYIASWAAVFMPGMDERRVSPMMTEDYPSGMAVEHARRASFQAPEGCQYLKAVLCLNEFQVDPSDPRFQPDVTRLLQALDKELAFRGLSKDRVATCKARISASAILLLAVRDGRADPNLWSAKKIHAAPQRQWSTEQREVLDIIATGLRVTDDMDASKQHRVLRVTGGPGTGKTEVLIAAAQQAIDDGCRVLIAGPIGLLVSMYRQRLLAGDQLTLETLHSSFKVTREADAQYIPPGRLRAYDLIILDEISQIDSHAWGQIKLALAELHPRPFVVLVGDFQQLQPIHGPHQLRLDLDRQHEQHQLATIQLQYHASARTVDPTMLAFLNHVRTAQPARATLEDFFRGRMLSSDPLTAATQAKLIEDETGKAFTFLTVTNRGALALNEARLALDFPHAAATLRQGGGLPADPTASADSRIVIEPNMRLRLTHNVHKDRGFVNGNVGTVRTVLRPDVFIFETIQNQLLLVHPITVDGHKFMPVAYAYATTIRRAQGATMDAVGLHLDKKVPDRGYAYVGASRVKSHEDIFLLGSIRATDWLPVGGPGSPEEHIKPGPLSDTSSSADEAEPSSSDDSQPGTSDFENGFESLFETP